VWARTPQSKRRSRKGGGGEHTNSKVEGQNRGRLGQIIGGGKNES